MGGYYNVPYTLLNFINCTKCVSFLITENITEINSAVFYLFSFLNFSGKFEFSFVFYFTCPLLSLLFFFFFKSSFNFVNSHPSVCILNVGAVKSVLSGPCLILIMSSTSYLLNFSSQLWISMFCNLPEQITDISSHHSLNSAHHFVFTLSLIQSAFISIY